MIGHKGNITCIESNFGIMIELVIGEVFFKSWVLLYHDSYFVVFMII